MPNWPVKKSNEKQRTYLLPRRQMRVRLVVSERSTSANNVGSFQFPFVSFERALNYSPHGLLSGFGGHQNFGFINVIRERHLKCTQLILLNVMMPISAVFEPVSRRDGDRVGCDRRGIAKH